MLWRPKQGASSSPQEFLAARALFIELHQDSGWNPWVLEDRTDDLERAQTVMTEWTRAEPGHRTMTKKQLDEKMARWDRDFKLRQAALRRGDATRPTVADRAAVAPRLRGGGTCKVPRWNPLPGDAGRPAPRRDREARILHRFTARVGRGVGRNGR